MHKEGPDQDGYERFACPAQGDHPHLCCPLRPQANALGKVPVLSPPAEPPKVCTQSAVTVAPDIGARHRQDLAFGSEEWASTYAAYRNTIEGWNGYVKDPAHEALAAPGRRRVRGIAAQSIFVALLLMAGNFRKIAAFRQMVADGTAEKVAERARRRRVSLSRLPLPALERPLNVVGRRCLWSDAGFPGLQPAPQHIAPLQSPVTVTAHRDTGLDASRQRSFVAVSGLVLSLTLGSPQRGSNPCLHLEREAGLPLQAADHYLRRGAGAVCGYGTPVHPKVGWRNVGRNGLASTKCRTRSSAEAVGRSGARQQGELEPRSKGVAPEAQAVVDPAYG